MRRSNFNWKYLRNVFLFVLLAFSILFLATFIHELVHASIYEKYGCSHNIYFTWEGGRTAGMCNTDMGIDKFTAMELEHQQLENWSKPIFYIGIPLIVIGIFFWFRKMEWL